MLATFSTFPTALPLNIPPVVLDEPIAISLLSKESTSWEVVSVLTLFAWAEVVVLPSFDVAMLSEFDVMTLCCFDVAMLSSFGVDPAMWVFMSRGAFTAFARRSREPWAQVGIGGRDTDADRSHSGGAMVIALRSRVRSVLQISS